MNLEVPSAVGVRRSYFRSCTAVGSEAFVDGGDVIIRLKNQG